MAPDKYPSPHKHCLLSQQFTPEFLEEVFALADAIRANPAAYAETLKGKVVATLFYEASTRTRLSFESAILRLGGGVISTENAKEFSSASKGETIEDTMRIVSLYADMIVMRHYDDDSYIRGLATVGVPLVNAGSGKSQHPTQGMLDVYTIWRHFKKLEGLTVAIVGDLLRGRTCDSLVYLLSKFPNNQFIFVSPENSKVKEGLKAHLTERAIAFEELDSLTSVLPKADVLYMTRIQKERFDDPTEYEKAKGKFVLTKAGIDTMKENAIILHPLPRVDEIAVEADGNSRSQYFEQAGNGLWVRMALLKILNDNR